ncbi:hypothetical protein BJX63DRAFT_399229 [Aspergillus granulosus]|uniref:Uncharacterized protein n=1 Tax=Aspergillus granulosus TaxID=176169 RepID=A0ABR4H7H3_9EURO
MHILSPASAVLAEVRTAYSPTESVWRRKSGQMTGWNGWFDSRFGITILVRRIASLACFSTLVSGNVMELSTGNYSAYLIA